MSIARMSEKILKSAIKFLLTGKHIEWLFKFYFFKLLKGEIKGIENIPDKGCILASNHVSHLDWVALYYVLNKIYNRQAYFIGKAKYSQYYDWRIYFEYSKTIVVDYWDINSVEDMYKTVERYMQEGKIVGILPEGTRSSNGKLRKAQGGLGNIVFRQKVPVVPVGLLGFYETWPNNKKFPKLRSKCTVKIGEPICFDTTDCKSRRAKEREITDTVMHKIAELTGQEYKY